MKNLFEGESLGSISMKEASSDTSSEALKEPSGLLSKDGFKSTSQLYEKLSIDRDCEVSMAWYTQNERKVSG